MYYQTQDEQEEKKTMEKQQQQHEMHVIWAHHLYCVYRSFQTLTCTLYTLTKTYSSSGVYVCSFSAEDPLPTHLITIEARKTEDWMRLNPCLCKTKWYYYLWQNTFSIVVGFTSILSCARMRPKSLIRNASSFRCSFTFLCFIHPKCHRIITILYSVVVICISYARNHYTLTIISILKV